MDRQSVISSNVASVGYDAATRALEVEFRNGGVYTYRDVPAEVAAGLVAADSVGGYLSRYIKGRYAYGRG
jgi:hypothetical protein